MSTKIIYFIIILYFINTLNSISNIVLSDSLGNIVNYSYQTTFNNDVSQIEPSLRLLKEEFTNADYQRYMLNGLTPFRETNISNTNIAIVAGSLSATFIGQHIYQANTIWKEKSDFKVIEDAKYTLGFDKATHFFGTYFPCYIMRESLLLTGFSNDAANLWGSVLGLAYNSYVEILDGYGDHFGFSPSDYYANIAGAAFFYAQSQLPVLQNFTPKFHYYPADWHNELERIPHDMFIDDYASQTVFMSINVHNLLPNNLKDYWPSWLELSCGLAVRNIFAPSNLVDQATKDLYYSKTEIHRDNDNVWASPRFMIGLDYNLVKLIPESWSGVNWFIQTLNYWKLPSPIIEFSQSGTRFYFMYPFLKL